ncbi:MAG: serine/threonine protein kinase, partial [Deltaproteobacteria bacterium]|nr:serine/threonine protein kinase [Deltaproteobacteria bacterium]
MKGTPGEVVLGRYRIEHPIGQGGFGRVFAARQVALDRQVAVKASVESGRGDPVARERFRREAVLVAAINHPNVVTYHDFGIDEDDDQVLVMEYLNAVTLLQVLRRHGALPPIRAARLVGQAAAGLGEAHARGLVHRDVKPSNLLLADPGTTAERVKVIDFGILRARGSAARELRDLTRTDAFVGTPAYVAPETILGREPDGRADQYALALVALEMVTGRRAFPADTGAESLLARVDQRPADLAAIGPRIAEVLGRALSPDPDGRYPVIRAFAAALEEAAAADDAPDPGRTSRISYPDVGPRPVEDAATPLRTRTISRRAVLAGLLAALLPAAAVVGWVAGAPEPAPVPAPRVDPVPEPAPVAEPAVPEAAAATDPVPEPQPEPAPVLVPSRSESPRPSAYPVRRTGTLV